MMKDDEEKHRFCRRCRRCCLCRTDWKIVSYLIQQMKDQCLHPLGKETINPFQLVSGEVEH